MHYVYIYGFVPLKGGYGAKESVSIYTCISNGATFAICSWMLEAATATAASLCDARTAEATLDPFMNLNDPHTH